MKVLEFLFLYDKLVSLCALSVIRSIFLTKFEISLVFFNFVYQSILSPKHEITRFQSKTLRPLVKHSGKALTMRTSDRVFDPLPWK